MDVAWGNGDLSKSACPAGPKALNFFGDSCVPGAMDPNINKANVSVPASVCAACLRGNKRKSVFTAYSDDFGDDDMALVPH